MIWIFLYIHLFVYFSSIFSGKDTIQSFKPGGQYVLVTFDGGPHSTYTSEVLDVLKKHKARCTFFVKGSNLKKENSHLIQRMMSERHDVESLGWEQDTFGSSTSDSVRNDHIQKTSALIEQYSGRAPVVIRSPLGSSSNDIHKAIYNTFGLKTILWSIDSRDWEISDPKTIVKNIVSRVQPGDVIVLHDTMAHAAQTLDQLIIELYGQSYELLTIREILSFPDDTPR